MNISEVLKGIELSDEQTKALDSFFENYTNYVKEKAKKELHEVVIEEVKAKMEDGVILKEEAEKAFALYEEDCKKAFELYKEDCEKAFMLFEEDADKAFNMGIEDSINDTQKEYTENMTKALQDLYEDIEERVKIDVFESKEFKALDKIREAVTPIMLNEDQKKLLDELEELKKEKEIISEEKEELNREKIINTLMKDFPIQYEEQVRNFISNAKDEEEIYERFNHIVEMIEVDPDMIKKTEPIEEAEEDKEDEKKDEEKEELKIKKKKKKKEEKESMAEESIFNVTKKDVEQKKNISGFTEDEENLINLAFPQMSSR